MRDKSECSQINETGQHFVVLKPIDKKGVTQMAHKATKASLMGYIHRLVPILVRGFGFWGEQKK